MLSAHNENSQPVLRVLPCQEDADLAPSAIELSIQYDDLFKVIVNAGWANESSGNTEAPCGYFSKISIEPGDKAGFEDLLSHQDYAEHLRARFDELEHGWYLTKQDDNGLIWVWFDSKANIERAYDYLGEQYVEWENDEDELPKHRYNSAPFCGKCGGPCEMNGEML